MLRTVFPTSPPAGPVETSSRSEYTGRARPREFTAGVRLDPAARTRKEALAAPRDAQTDGTPRQSSSTTTGNGPTSSGRSSRSSTPAEQRPREARRRAHRPRLQTQRRDRERAKRVESERRATDQIRTVLIQSRQTLRISISPQPKARALPRPAPSVARNVSGSFTDRIPLTSSTPNVTRLFPDLESCRTE